MPSAAGQYSASIGRSSTSIGGDDYEGRVAGDPWKHLLGITLGVAVAVLWVASNEIIQFIFQSRSYDKPFLVTYVSASLFTIYLAGFAFVPHWGISLRRSARLEAEMQGKVYVPLVEKDSLPPSPGPQQEESRRFSVREVFRLAVIFAPLFFASNYAFNVSLDLTSVASASTFSTLSCIFTIALAAAARVERFSWPKLFSAVVTFAGVALISNSDGRTGGERSLVGDLVCIVAAFLYALYATGLKKAVPHDNNLDMPMLFGFVGLITMVCFWPGLLFLHYLKLETLEVPSRSVFLYLTFNALMGTVLAEYLWARSIVLTTPLISTLALSLTAPFSVVADVVLHSEKFSVPYIAGVVFVIGGFVVANADEAISTRTTASQGDSAVEQPFPSGTDVEEAAP